MEKQMSKRSPRYPSDSLQDALERVRAVFEADRQNPIDRSTVAHHMGYSGISGASDKTISNLMQYGLLERIGKGEVRVSRLAVDILHPEPGSTGAEELAEAAFKPKLFADLKSRFDQTPSREALKSYLKREGFLERAINPIASAYLDTCHYLEQNGANDFGIPSEGDVEELVPVATQELSPMHIQAPIRPNQSQPQPPVTPLKDEPIYTISGGRIALGGAIINKRQANEVINLINAVMGMLPDEKAIEEGPED